METTTTWAVELLEADEVASDEAALVEEVPPVNELPPVEEVDPVSAVDAEDEDEDVPDPVTC